MTRVLVVDDHDGVARAVAAMARTSGCAAAAVNSGRAAIDFLQAEQVDLVVLDVAMPGMSGLDVLRSMRHQGMLPRTPVLMFSATEDARAESLRLGATDFVLKGEVDDLLQHIRRFAADDRSAGAVDPER